MANYQISYRFQGVSAHAAMSPELGRSALDALELMNVGVQFLREHVPTDTRIHYAITDTGGNAPGVVQSHAQALYLLRAVQLPQVKELYQRVNQIARGAAMMTGTEVEITFIKSCSNMLINTELNQLMQRNLVEPLSSWRRRTWNWPGAFGRHWAQYTLISILWPLRLPTRRSVPEWRRMPIPWSIGSCSRWPENVRALSPPMWAM